jgi:GAF domain-containing protein
MQTGWRAPVEDMLSRLGPVMGVSRVLLMKNSISADGRYLQDDLFEWDAPGIHRRMSGSSLVDIPLKDDAFQEDRARCARGEVVHARVRDLPKDQRDWMTLEGVKSYMRVPITAGGKWWGTVGFDACVDECTWQPLDVEALQAMAGLIGVAIVHDQTLSALRDSEQRFRGILESALDGIVTIDAGNASSSSPQARP